MHPLEEFLRMIGETLEKRLGKSLENFLTEFLEKL